MNIKRIMSKKRVILSVIAVVGLSMSARLFPMDFLQSLNEKKKKCYEKIDQAMKNIRSANKVGSRRIWNTKIKRKKVGIKEKELELKRKQESKQFSDILTAIKMGEIDKVKFFVENNVDVLSKCDKNGNTLLLKACIYSDCKIVEYLLLYCRKKIINKAGSFNMTPLSKACQFNDFNMIRLLIRNGATISEKKKNTYDKEMVKYLKEELSKQSSSSLEKIEKLKLKRIKELKRTRAEELKIVKELKRKRVEELKRIKELKLKKDLEEVIKNNDFKKIKLLLSEGKFFNKNSKNGYLPLLIACSCNNLDMVEFLLNNGARRFINDANKEGLTPLLMACNSNNLKLVKILIDNGASISINKAGKKGWTPLFLAYCNESLDMILFFIEKGINIKELLKKDSNEYGEDFLNGVNALDQIVKTFTPRYAKIYYLTRSAVSIKKLEENKYFGPLLKGDSSLMQKYQNLLTQRYRKFDELCKEVKLDKRKKVFLQTFVISHLDLDEKLTCEEICKKIRKILFKWHPDRFPVEEFGRYIHDLSERFATFLNEVRGQLA